MRMHGVELLKRGCLEQGFSLQGPVNSCSHPRDVGSPLGKPFDNSDFSTATAIAKAEGSINTLACQLSQTKKLKDS